VRIRESRWGLSQSGGEEGGEGEESSHSLLKEGRVIWVPVLADEEGLVVVDEVGV
jgi:hypothetical protein